MTPDQQLITSGIRAAAARSSDKIAIECPNGVSRTYAQLVDRIEAIKRVAVNLWGLYHGDVVAIISPNATEYFELVGALSELGIACATVNYRLTAAEVKQIVTDATAKVVVYHPGCADLLSKSKDTDGVRHTVSMGADLDALLDGEAKGEAIQASASEADVFAIPYTSGTTGLPKGVCISHRNRVSTFYAMAAEYQCYSSASHFLAIAPLCHGAGFAFSCATIFFGGRVTLLTEFDPEFVLRELAKGEVDGIFMVPTHFQAIFSLPQEILDECRGKHRLRTIISNAAPLAQSMKETIIDYFGEGILHETYGSTEAGIVTNLRPKDQLRKTKCVGQPFVENLVSLRDENGQEVPANTPGELFSKSPTLFSGYWQRPDATEEAVADGWVSVGDIAVRDDEGYIYIVDRKKDMIISGGINIYPREVEDILNGHPDVLETALYGKADEKWGEVIHAAVVAKAEAVDFDALSAWLAERVASYKLPKHYRLIDALPRNANGKILKRVLAEEAD